MRRRKSEPKSRTCANCECPIPPGFADAGFTTCSAGCWLAFYDEGLREERPVFSGHPENGFCAYCGQTIPQKRRDVCQASCLRKLGGASKNAGAAMEEPDTSLAEALSAAVGLPWPPAGDPATQGRKTTPHDLGRAATKQLLLQTLRPCEFPEQCWLLHDDRDVVPEQKFWDRVDIIDGRLKYRKP